MKKWKLMKQISELKQGVKDWQFDARRQHEQAVHAQRRADKMGLELVSVKSANTALRAAIRVGENDETR